MDIPNPSENPQEHLDALPESQQPAALGEVALNGSLSDQEKIDQLVQGYTPEELASQLVQASAENESLRDKYKEADGKYREIVGDRNRGIEREYDLAEKVEELEERLAIAEPLAAKAKVDPLTKLPNREGVMDEYERTTDSLERFKRRGLTATAIALDLDGFKRFNTLHGHPEGDTLLRAVTKAYLNHLNRTSDFIGRMGGDEFIAILSDTSIEDAVNTTLELQKVIRFEVGKLHGVLTNLGVSAGIVKINPNEDFDTMYQRVDAALMQAKEVKEETGEYNQIVINPDSIEEQPR